MKKKIICFFIIYVALIMLWSCSAHAATNVLLFTEEETVNGKTVASMLEQIGTTEFIITEVPISTGSSLKQEVNKFEPNGSTYDSVIIQLPYDNIVSGEAAISENVEAINALSSKLGNSGNTAYYMATPVGTIANYESEILLAGNAIENIVSKLTISGVMRIPVYENLHEASSKSLGVFDNNKMTTLGNLLVACSYSNSLGKSVENLTSYKNDTISLPDADVKEIAKIASNSGTASLEPETPAPTTPEPVTAEPEPEEKVEEGSDQIEAIGGVVAEVNREPIVEMVCSDPTELKIRVYDKEGAGVKSASLKINDSNGTKIEQESIEGEKAKSYVFKIDSQKYLDKNEYKQFYIFAEDNDGCILKEFFRVKYVEESENGSCYKVNRAPRIRPELMTKIDLVKTHKISLHVTDQTGIKKVTPKTVDAEGYVAKNLYAGGNYDGYNGIDGQYDWQDVTSKTTTSSTVYVKDQVNVDKLSSLSDVPSTITFVVGP